MRKYSWRNSPWERASPLRRSGVLDPVDRATRLLIIVPSSSRIDAESKQYLRERETLAFTAGEHDAVLADHCIESGRDALFSCHGGRTAAQGFARCR